MIWKPGCRGSERFGMLMEEVTSSSQDQIFYKIWAFWKAWAKEVDKSLLGKKDFCLFVESENTGKCLIFTRLFLH